jgi:hypothetical protein
MDLFTLLILIGVLLLLPTAYAAKIGAPYAPTFSAAIKNAFDFIKVNKNDVLVDLGAGDGKVLLAAHAREAEAIGYELSPIMAAIVCFRTLGKKRIKIHLSNFYKKKLPPKTTIIFAFLMPENMNKVRQYLAQQELPNLRLVVIYAFPFKDVAPVKTIHTPKCARMFIYDPKELKNK